MKKNKKPVLDWDKFREQFVRWTLRRASFRWPPRGEALKAARVFRGLYKCATCGVLWKNNEIKVDHIEPVVPTMPGRPEELTDIGRYVLRMFPVASGFQVLCKGCHDTKTKGENDARREAKRLNRDRSGQRPGESSSDPKPRKRNRGSKG